MLADTRWRRASSATIPPTDEFDLIEPSGRRHRFRRMRLGDHASLAAAPSWPASRFGQSSTRQRSGAIIRQPSANYPWGTREMNVQDLDGYRLRRDRPWDGVDLDESP